MDSSPWKSLSVLAVLFVVWFGGWWGWSLLAARESVREGRAPTLLAARLGGKWLGNTSPRGRTYRNLAIAWVLLPVLLMALVAVVFGLRKGS
jgi:hypothetical protein